MKTQLCACTALMALLLSLAMMPTASANSQWPGLDLSTNAAGVLLPDGTFWIQPASDRAALEAWTGLPAVVDTVGNLLANVPGITAVRMEGHVAGPGLATWLQGNGLSQLVVLPAFLPGYAQAHRYEAP